MIEGLIRKGLILSIILLLISMNTIASTANFISLNSISPTVYDSKTLYVGGSGLGNYSTIQSAIDDASYGDTIFVYSGIYKEDVTIDKSIMLKGENRDSTFIDGTEICINVLVDNVYITGFTLEHGHRAGVYSYKTNNIVVDGNVITHDENGVALYNCHKAVIKNNIVTRNCQGFYIWQSYGCTISNNIICFNYDTSGMYVLFSDHINIIGNNISNNNLWGINLWDVHICYIKDNIITNNHYSGIAPGNGADFITIENNTIISNGLDGIVINARCSIITRNTVLSNGRNGINTNGVALNVVSYNYVKWNADNGIRVYDARNNFYLSNYITNNTEYGIKAGYDYDDTRKNDGNNHFYCNNIVNNSVNAWDSGNSYWYAEPRMLGNYWSDYIGEDNDGDGIGDTPYKISGGNNEDPFPSMEPISGCENLPPSDPYVLGPTSGKVGNSYTYTFQTIDPDVDDVSYYIEWGDGSTTSWTAFQPAGYTEHSISHTWQQKGRFTIKAKAKDPNGLESDWGTMTVSVPRIRLFNNPLFTKFIEVFMDWFPLFTRLLKLF